LNSPPARAIALDGDGEGTQTKRTAEPFSIFYFLEIGLITLVQGLAASPSDSLYIGIVMMSPIGPSRKTMLGWVDADNINAGGTSNEDHD
jgi:hypothetical protein